MLRLLNIVLLLLLLFSWSDRCEVVECLSSVGFVKNKWRWKTTKFGEYIDILRDKSPYWLGTVFTASARPISVTFALRWLQPLDEPTCVQRRVAILWSLEHEQNWANGVSVYLHRRCGTHSLIRSSILLQAANIFKENWKHTCLGKPTHQPLRTIEEWTHLLTYLLINSSRKKEARESANGLKTATGSCSAGVDEWRMDLMVVQSDLGFLEQPLIFGTAIDWTLHANSWTVH